MAVFKPAGPPQRQKMKRVEEGCSSDEGLEPDLDVEVPVFVRLPRKRIRSVRFHVKNRVRLAPNPIIPEAIE